MEKRGETDILETLEQKIIDNRGKDRELVLELCTELEQDTIIFPAMHLC